MKYLFHHDETLRNLRVWSGNTPLVKACFYFWLPGQQMQKSLEGLLQTLLHHILHACPELAPRICPERWEAESQPSDVTLRNPWTLPELQKSFALFRLQCDINYKFYFQIDGLDEYHGDSWDVIETLRNLSASPNVKLCLSSRPWNCFQDFLGRTSPHVLRLHHYTRLDIELFARENLLTHGSYMQFEPTPLHDLVRDIGERAQGVFLWVRLVVRSLRNGIDNKDPIPILQERLRAIPSDLEDFFEQILGSVEYIYRSRMAGTFLAAMRSPQPLKLIHYYFLEDGDTTFGFDLPSETWAQSDIQERAFLTERRLNGRFKGLLETTSPNEVTAQTKVDFLHRTLHEFLETKRMRDKLHSWASQEPNVWIAISRALIAESKFIDEYACTDTLKLAMEMASKGVLETGTTAHCFEIIDQAELEKKRTSPSHAQCGMNCYLLRFAASIGHEEYLIYRMQKDNISLDLDRILRHAIACPLEADETYDLCVPFLYRGRSNEHGNSFVPALSRPTGGAPSPTLVKVLLGLGADLNAVIDGTSSWIVLVDQVPRLMDGIHSEQCLAVLELFLENGADMDPATETWIGILNRKNADLHDNPQNTLRYLRGLLNHGLDPNAAIQDTTLTKEFLRVLARKSSHMSNAWPAHNELLREFLRHGADISLVFNDRSSLGWFAGVCHTLSHSQLFWGDSLTPRIKQYRILLEHGLDLNATLDGRTLWGSLLEAMHHGFRWGVRSEGPKSFLHDLFLLSLQYGADPYVPKIRQLLANKPPLACKEVLANMERALQRASDERARQTKSQSRPPRERDSSSRRGLRKHSKESSTIARPETFQAKKRDRGDTSYSNHLPKSKRARFR